MGKGKRIMKVALIGANGQLGSDIVKTRPPNIELIPLTRKEVDIREKEKLEDILLKIKPDAVINTAAYHKTDECEGNPELSFHVNSIAVMNLAIICNQLASRIVHISTDYVFDGEKLRKKEPYTEEDIPNPLNVYGISKYVGELFLRNYHDKYYIIRISSLFGKAGASGKGGNFVYTILKKGKENATLRIINDIYMSPTYALDAAKKIWSILLEERPYGIYHCANAGVCSWYEFAKKILEFGGYKSKIIPISHTEYPTKAKRPLWSPLKSNKIVTRGWEEALEEFISEVSKLK